MKCPDEFGIYSAMTALDMPEHLLKIHGGYYENLTTCDIDLCLVDEIKFLWDEGIVTMGCCCGHGIAKGMINVSESSVGKMLELGYEPLEKIEGFWEYSFIPKSKHNKLDL